MAEAVPTPPLTDPLATLLPQNTLIQQVMRRPKAINIAIQLLRVQNRIIMLIGMLIRQRLMHPCIATTSQQTTTIQ